MTLEKYFEESERARTLVLPVQAAWALHAATLIDDWSPGFLAALVRSKGLRRHVLHAVLAASLSEHIEEFPVAVSDEHRAGALRALGETLRMMKPRAALEAAFGVPRFEGLRVFSRLVEPLQPQDYIHLIEVLSDPAERWRRQVLQHTPFLDHDRLRAILALDPALCTVRFGGIIRSEAKAKIANDVVAVVRARRPELTDVQLHEFCGQARPFAPFVEQVERLLGLVEELPELSFPTPRGFRHLRTKKDFEECGRRFRNCIASRFLDHALTGRIIFLEFLPRPAIAALMPTSAGLMLSKVHAVGNADVTPDLVEEVRSCLASAGIPYVAPTGLVGSLAGVHFALMRRNPFGFDPDVFDDEAPDLD